VPSDLTSIAATPNTLSLTRGGPAASTTITPTFLPGYNGGFSVSTSAVPTGLSSSVALTVSGSTETCTITFTPGTGLVAGTYPILVTANADDGVAKYAYVVITVQ
jgi:hypothetical protein